jgi:hypothetical protein
MGNPPVNTERVGSRGRAFHDGIREREEIIVREPQVA